jgi:hypothetical protein
MLSWQASFFKSAEKILANVYCFLKYRAGACIPTAGGAIVPAIKRQPPVFVTLKA